MRTDWLFRLLQSDFVTAYNTSVTILFVLKSPNQSANMVREKTTSYTHIFASFMITRFYFIALVGTRMTFWPGHYEAKIILLVIASFL